MSNSPIVDFHVHVFEDKLGQRLDQVLPLISGHPLAQKLEPEKLAERIEKLRKQARSWLKPVTSSMHKAQTMLRHLPGPARHVIDQVSGLAPLPGLLVESTPKDLISAMDEASVERAVVIANPPYTSSEMVLALAAENPRLVPCVYVPAGTEKPGEALRALADQGAKILKIHPPADGEGPDSPRYLELLEVADELGMMLILHTGCVHSSVLYKDPEQGHVQRFEPWFKKHPKLQVILAHMNFHHPLAALDLAEKYPALWVDTSWQPAEVIGEAARRIGPERVLFGTDWPFVGANFEVGIQRVWDCVESGTLNSSGADRILGKNAAELLKK